MMIKPKEDNSRSSTPWLFTLITAILAVSLVFYVDKLEQAQMVQETDTYTLEQLSSLRSEIESHINNTVQLFQGLAAQIAVNPNISDETLKKIIAELMNKQYLLRNVGIAEQYTITQVYPLSGNEAAIGLNYLKSPGQRDEVLQAVDTGQIILSGPLQLIQGGTAIIVRMPIFTSDEYQGRNAGDYWGLISLVIDMSKLFAITDLDTNIWPINVAIRGATGKSIFGDQTLFEQGKNELKVVLPGDTWSIVGKPNKTLITRVTERRSLIRGLGIAVALLVSMLTFFFARQFQQQKAIIAVQNSSRQQIWHAATHDRLTGMANRHLFYEELSHIVANAKRQQHKVAVFFLDLDRFKEINDSFGHSTGDEFLKAFSERLQTIVRDTEILARLGGDEFAIIAADISVEAATDLAIRISESLNTPVQFDHHALHAGVSVGVAMYPDDGLDPETLTHNADLAMYAAKENPLSSFSFFEDAMNQAAIERKQLVDQIREGIRHEQFHMAYQPIIDIKTGECAGLEALARWTHPKQGTISPGHFIPAAESSGLIIPLGQWVLHQALSDNQQLLMRNPQMVLSVNLSPVQLFRGKPVELVQNALDETGISPQQLDIEITESTILEDVDVATQTIQELRALGISVTIDDFGTGYSSLSHLQHLPVSRIKIDLSFVQGIGVLPHSEIIIKAIMFLSRALKVRVTAEGVETQEQLEFLRLLDCEEIQGYYFSKPVPVNELADTLSRLKNQTMDYNQQR